MLVDTSVLIRTLQPHHSLYPSADGAIRILPEQGRKLHIVAQNLTLSAQAFGAVVRGGKNELWVVATQPLGENGLGMTPAEAAVELGRVKGLFFFLPETPTIYPAWEALVLDNAVAGKLSHDARLVAAMQVHGLTAVLTFDKTGFSRFPGIEVIHPAEIMKESIEKEG